MFSFSSSCRTKISPENANYCSNCGSEVEQDIHSLIAQYFHRGIRYDTIVKILKKFHGIDMHVRTLKRKLQDMGLKRKITSLDIDLVRETIQCEMEGAGELAGYRYIWHALRLRHHMHVPRAKVAKIMKEIDPVGVQERAKRRLCRRRYISRGPNFCWHLDGYDKLKPYGFPIHGCICGFSRRILWLELDHSNNDPKITARFYLDTVEKLKGCPKIVRSDCGSENVIIAGMQCYFRAESSDEFCKEKAHQYGSSPANQRIEGWWSSFGKSRSSFWINWFKDMVDAGILELGDEFDMKCLWFCYSRLLQKELENVKEHWNSHYIRKSRHDTVAGVPDILYFLPESVGFVDCVVAVPHDKIKQVQSECEVDHDDNNELYNEYFIHIMEANDWAFPENEKEALSLFQKFKLLQTP